MKVLFYCGRPVEELSKEELLAALYNAAYLYKEELDTRLRREADELWKED